MAHMSKENIEERAYRFCPICGTKATYFEVPFAEPFTHTDPLDGLLIWGAFSEGKEIVCRDGDCVHLKILIAEEHHRLVKLNVPSPPANDLPF